MSRQSGNDETHVRKALDQIYAALGSAINGVSAREEHLYFCSNPAQYEWKYAGRKKVLVPQNCVLEHRIKPQYPAPPEPKHFMVAKWELRGVWIVEGVLHRGESNLLARRRFYLDEDSWQILLGDGYDYNERLVSYYMHHRCVSTNMLQWGQWYSICPVQDAKSSSNLSSDGHNHLF